MCCETGLTHIAAQAGVVLQYNDIVFMQVFTLNLTIQLYDSFFIGWGFVLLEDLPDLTDVQHIYKDIMGNKQYHI